MGPHFYRYLFLFTFLFSGLLSQAQFDSEKYDKESFLIGTLREYMGYQRTFTQGDDSYYERVNIVSSYGLKNSLFIDSLFESDYTDIAILNGGGSQWVTMYSPTLARTIDTYYHYQPSIISTLAGDRVYSGSLKKDQFDTEKQKLSFLLGTYLRFGEDRDIANVVIRSLKKDGLLKAEKEYEDRSYVLFLPNASSKAKRCARLLKDFACKEVEYVFRETTIPNGNFVLFIPSGPILEVINEAERLRLEIEKIDTKYVEFTPNGTKYIWQEPVKPPVRKSSKKSVIVSGYGHQ